LSSMKGPFERPFEAGHHYEVTPDEIEALVQSLHSMELPVLTISTFPQYEGGDVYAFTLTAPDGAGAEGKHRLFISRPHAHEPAGTAACTELLKALLGLGDCAEGGEAWRRWVLDHFVLTLVPDANPGGSRRAPVKFRDGSEISNEQFFLWMFGESGEEPGARFPRVPAWDAREVTPPALVGITCEQIDSYLFVEPNRDTRSTFFRSFFELDKLHDYEVWLDLHQTEFIGSDRNAEMHLPTCQDELPETMATRHRELGEAIHASWRQAGGNPKEAPVVPYRTNEEQRAFLTKVWEPVSKTKVHLVTEVQNNHPRTPVPLQVHLQLAAILETMRWMVRRKA